VHQPRLFAPTGRELGLSFFGDGQCVEWFHDATVHYLIPEIKRVSVVPAYFLPELAGMR
jgi:hypothetical protein